MVFAGAGNNGADALIVAKLLIEAGFNPHVVLINVKGDSLARLPYGPRGADAHGQCLDD